jgi:hypothetical protein
MHHTRAAGDTRRRWLLNAEVIEVLKWQAQALNTSLFENLLRDNSNYDAKAAARCVRQARAQTQTRSLTRAPTARKKPAHEAVPGRRRGMAADGLQHPAPGSCGSHRTAASRRFAGTCRTKPFQFFQPCTRRELSLCPCGCRRKTAGSCCGRTSTTSKICPLRRPRPRGCA